MNIEESHLRVLEAIHDSPGGEANFAHLQHGRYLLGLARTMDELENGGLIRKTDRDDLRGPWYTLTEAGERAVRVYGL